MTDDRSNAIALLEAQRSALTLAIEALRSDVGPPAPSPASSPALSDELRQLLRQMPNRHVASEIFRDLLNEEPRDWSIGELIQTCRDRGHEMAGVNEKNVASVLSRDVRDGRAVRTGRGRYMAARHLRT